MSNFQYVFRNSKILVKVELKSINFHFEIKVMRTEEKEIYLFSCVVWILGPTTSKENLL